MNILVTGATGFIGKHLISYLSKRHNLYILVRSGSNCTFLNVNNVFVFSENIDELAAYLRKEKIDGIIHLASFYIAEHKSEQIKDLVLSNIYLGTALLEACKKAETKWFLNTGTIWQNYNVSDKSDEYNPVDLYAASKQAFITMAKYYTETSKLRFCTLKLCDTYGPGDTRKKVLALFDRIAFTGESETPREVAQMVRDEIARLRQNGVDPELFTLVKNQMYGEMLADVENVDDAAEEMGMAFLKGRTLADEIEALATLTVDDVNKALQTMLLEENSAYIQIDPKE